MNPKDRGQNCKQAFEAGDAFSLSPRERAGVRGKTAPPVDQTHGQRLDSTPHRASVLLTRGSGLIRRGLPLACPHPRGANGDGAGIFRSWACVLPLPGGEGWGGGKGGLQLSGPPLPGGEGRGEGEGGLQLSGTRRFAWRGALFLFPLPGGEGQGEGEGGLQLSGTRRFAWRGALFFFAHRPAVIRQRMRGALLQRPPNCVTDGVFFAPQAGVLESKHLDAARFQQRIAFGILGLLLRRAVLEPVQLEVQPRFQAKEVKGMPPERMLTAKLVAGEPPVAQPTPHEFLGPRFLLAQYTCDAGKARGRHEVSLVEFIDSSQAHWCFERCFPLTPALSLGERENRPPRIRQSRATRLVTARDAVSPLPAGEGQGEGERDEANRNGRTNFAGATRSARRVKVGYLIERRACRRLFANPERLDSSQRGMRCSLSLRERARVRGNETKPTETAGRISPAQLDRLAESRSAISSSAEPVEGRRRDPVDQIHAQCSDATPLPFPRGEGIHHRSELYPADALGNGTTNYEHHRSQARRHSPSEAIVLAGKSI